MGTRDGPSSVRLYRDAGRSISVTMEALCLLLPIGITGDFRSGYQPLTGKTIGVSSIVRGQTIGVRANNWCQFNFPGKQLVSVQLS
jgi:hypothetical protein